MIPNDIGSSSLEGDSFTKLHALGLTNEKILQASQFISDDLLGGDDPDTEWIVLGLELSASATSTFQLTDGVDPKGQKYFMAANSNTGLIPVRVKIGRGKSMHYSSTGTGTISITVHYGRKAYGLSQRA